MSTFISSQCWPLQLPATQKLVLASLPDQANDEGVCWPSIASLMRRTCLSERAVRNALRALEDQRLLRTSARDGSSNWYTVTPLAHTPAPDAPLHPMPPAPAPEAPPPGPRCRTPRHQMPPEPSLNHQVTVKEPKAPRKRAAVMEVALPEWLDPQAWQQFVEFRKRKAPLTARAAELAIAELGKLRDQGHDPVAVINQSILNGWRGLFALKENNHAAHRNGHRGHRESEAERVERINRELDERERGDRPPGF